MKKSFLEYMALREAKEEKKPVSAEIKLSDDSDYKPFVVSDEVHPNLRPIVKAFLDSSNVAYPGSRGLGSKLTTLDKSGETTPKLKKKSLYLVGGAVRDHLQGRTPKDYDLATDATPDEIRLILANAGFKESAPQGGGNAPKKGYENLKEPGGKNKIFYAKGWDRGGNEFVIGAKVNGEEFEIATFRKDSKGGDGRTPDKMEFSGLEDDSSRRDFTQNSMYIPLTSADGPNGKLIDPHGGAHHLRSGEVNFVGNPKERLEEDQLRALRYIRFAAASGKTQIPQEILSAIEDIKDLPSVSRERIREEFLKGLEHPDIDPKKYIGMYKQSGLLNTVFPRMTFKLDSPNDFSDTKDKRLALAWLLRGNSPSAVQSMLKDSNWTNNEVSDIIHLIKIAGWMDSKGQDEEDFYDQFYDIKNALHQRTGLVPSTVRKWGQMIGADADTLEKFLGHNLDTKAYVPGAFGGRQINPELLRLYQGRTPQGAEFGRGIKQLETDKFKNSLRKKE